MAGKGGGICGYAVSFATFPAIGTEMSVLIKSAYDDTLSMVGNKHLEKRSPLLLLLLLLSYLGFIFLRQYFI